MLQIKKNHFKLLFTGVLLFFFTISSHSQTANAQSEFWNKVRFGGGIGLGFGNNSFNASVSPSAIYQADNQWAFGTGLIFNYSTFNDARLVAYGANVLSLFNPINAIQLSAEFEELRVSRTLEINNAPDFKESYWYPALYLGVGYTSRNITFGIRYDVLYDASTSIYADPWAPFVRVYF